MNPQLPKVETKPLINEETRQGVERAYETSPEGQQAVLKDPSEVLRVGGSFGVEAGLTDFEAISDDGTSDNDDDNSSDDSADASVVMAPSPAKLAVGGVAVAHTPEVADDKDDIEKEWVSKAKRIVEQTKSDPYLQERAVSRLQADYLKKRFNKDIKLSEGDT